MTVISSDHSLLSFDPVVFLSHELALPERSIKAVIALFDEGSTVPFIARYRKEATGNLDEVQIRTIQERLSYILELESRRKTILQSIQEQGKLTKELQKQILECTTKNTLEDLYLPYKPKRRTKAMIAKEKGLEPLAILILEQSLHGDLEQEALKHLSEEKEVKDVKTALAGARDIIAEIVSEKAEVRAFVRKRFTEEGLLISKVSSTHGTAPSKFEQYYEHQELIAKIPSHRYLAIRRGEQEGVLQVELQVEVDPLLQQIECMMNLVERSPFAVQLRLAIADSYKRLLAPSIETDVRVDLKMQSDHAAVEIFASNLRNLLLAAPLGQRAERM